MARQLDLLHKLGYYASLLSNLSDLFQRSGRSLIGLGRREEAVEVEWQAVELLVPAVALERPEPQPPRQPPVLARVLHLQRVVQEHGHDQPHRRRRREDGVDVVVELQSSQVTHTHTKVSRHDLKN